MRIATWNAHLLKARHVRVGAVCLAVLVLVAGCGSGPSGVYVPSTPVPVPSPSPMPDADAAADALRAFARLKDRADLTFRVDETVTGVAEGESVTATMRLDVAGADFAAVMEIAGKTLQARQVNGKAYARAPGGRWVRGDPNETSAADLANPWLYLCWLDDLRYTGPPSEHPEAFGYECERPYAYQSLTMRQAGRTATMRNLVLVLAGDGTPVEMRMEGDGATDPSRPSTFEATMAFSKVGEPITIKAPK